ncbi:MAG: DNA mismatch endonuclease Vsr [Acidobacteriota bacterium]
MSDGLSRTERSELMSRIRDRDTTPERKLRAIVRRLGFKARLHVTRLPGSPDIVVDAARTAIFAHGCFWHRHSCARGESRPTTRAAFWSAKFQDNVRRDRRAARALRRLGWRVIVVWECRLRRAEIPRLERRLGRLLRTALALRRTPVQATGTRCPSSARGSVHLSCVSTSR